MKKVNFITTLSPQKQYELRRWFVVTFFLSACALFFGMYCVVPKLYVLWSLKKEMTILRGTTKTYGDATKNRNVLKEEYDTLRARENKLDVYRNKAKNPQRYIAVIMQACNEQVQLESLRCNKKECEITIVCPTAEHATIFIKQLNSSDVFSRVKMVSLQQDGQNKLLRCVIKGMIVRF